MNNLEVNNQESHIDSKIIETVINYWIEDLKNPRLNNIFLEERHRKLPLPDTEQETRFAIDIATFVRKELATKEVCELKTKEEYPPVFLTESLKRHHINRLLSVNTTMHITSEDVKVKYNKEEEFTTIYTNNKRYKK